MKKKILVLTSVFIMIATGLYAGSGDVFVEGSWDHDSYRENTI